MSFTMDANRSLCSLRVDVPKHHGIVGMSQGRVWKATPQIHQSLSITDSKKVVKGYVDGLVIVVWTWSTLSASFSCFSNFVYPKIPKPPIFSYKSLLNMITWIS